MFLLSQPNPDDIQTYVERASNSGFSYPDIGATRDGNDLKPPSSCNVDHNRILIGNGESAFDRAKQAIRDWKMFDFPWVKLWWPDTKIEKDRTVAIVVRHFGFYSVNAARIVYTIDEPNWFGFAYGTLEDHGESGEERFSVRLDRESGDVIYDLYAFSRPNHLLAHLGYPLTRMLQKRFAEDSKRAMFRAVRTIG